MNGSEKRIVAFEHAPYEDPGYITKWIGMQFPYLEVNLWEGDPLPDPENVRMLVIMGGPMNIYEDKIYPWLVTEKGYIRRFIELERPILGICLGAQLLSDCLGGVVTRLFSPEYGWYDVVQKDLLSDILPYEVFPRKLTTFQWHQDIFSIPPDATHIYSSENCKNQGFIFRKNLVGLQFHPEMENETILQFLSRVETDPVIKYDQYSKEDIIKNIASYEEGNKFIAKLMQYLLLVL